MLELWIGSKLLCYQEEKHYYAVFAKQLQALFLQWNYNPYYKKLNSLETYSLNKDTSKRIAFTKKYMILFLFS